VFLENDLDLFIKKKKSHKIKSYKKQESNLDEAIELKNFIVSDDPISQGRFGKVYKCSHKSKQYALKKIRLRINDEEGLSSTENEVELLEKIFCLSTKPRTFPKYHGYVKELNDSKQPTFNLFFDFYPTDLRTKLRSSPDKTLAYTTIKQYFYDLINGFAFLQSWSISHRDIKPENFLIDKDNQIVIIDFGIIQKIQNPNANQDQVWKIKGTPSYFSPEYIKATIDGKDEISLNLFKADVFSLGLVVLEMGGVFDSENSQVFENIREMKTDIASKIQRFAEKFNVEIANDSSQNSVFYLLKKCLKFQQKTRPDFIELFFSKFESKMNDKLKFHIYIEDHEKIIFKRKEKEEKLREYNEKHPAFSTRAQINYNKTKNCCTSCCENFFDFLSACISKSCTTTGGFCQKFFDFLSKNCGFLSAFIFKSPCYTYRLLWLTGLIVMNLASLILKFNHLSMIDDFYLNNFSTLYNSMKALIGIDLFSCLCRIVQICREFYNFRLRENHKVNLNIIVVIALVCAFFSRIIVSSLYLYQNSYASDANYHNGRVNLLRVSLKSQGKYGSLLANDEIEIAFLVILPIYHFFSLVSLVLSI